MLSCERGKGVVRKWKNGKILFLLYVHAKHRNRCCYERIQLSRFPFIVIMSLVLTHNSMLWWFSGLHAVASKYPDVWTFDASDRSQFLVQARVHKAFKTILKRGEKKNGFQGKWKRKILTRLIGFWLSKRPRGTEDWDEVERSYQRERQRVRESKMGMISTLTSSIKVEGMVISYHEQVMANKVHCNERWMTDVSFCEIIGTPIEGRANWPSDQFCPRNDSQFAHGYWGDKTENWPKSR